MLDIFSNITGLREPPDTETGPCCTWEHGCNCSGSAGEESDVKKEEE